MQIFKLMFILFLIITTVYAEDNATIEKISFDSNVTNSWGRYTLKSGDFLYLLGDSQYPDNFTRIIKTDLNLSTIWDKQYKFSDDPYNSTQILNHAIDTGDGIVMVGYFTPNYTSGSSSTFVRKINYDGTELFLKQYQNTDGAYYQYMGEHIVKSTNGFIISGYDYDQNSTIGISILKLDENGDEIKRLKYMTDYAANENFSGAYEDALVATDDGGYILGSSVQFSSGAPQERISVIERFDANDNLVWHWDLNGTDYDSSTNQLVVKNGKLYAGISHGWGGLFLKFNKFNLENGNVESTHEFSQTIHFLPTQDDGFLFYNDVQGWGTVQTDLELSRVDSNLNELWSYTKSYDTAHHIKNFVQISQDEFTVVGYNNNYDYTPNFLVFKLLANPQSIQTISSFNIINGWQLLGAVEDLDVTSFNNTCVDSIWKYSSGSWQLHIANGETYTIPSGVTENVSLNQGDGFWIKGNGSCEVNATY